MYSRWFSVAVVVLWLASMGWLLQSKVLPPIVEGEPPSFRTIGEARLKEPPVGWTLSLNDRRLGWAVSTARRLPNQQSEIRSHVRFERIPLEELAFGWLREMFQLIEPSSSRLRLDARSTMTLDDRWRLMNFDSVVHVEPLAKVIRLQGAVEGTQVSLAVRSDGSSYQTDVRLPSDGLLSDALSPQTQLPHLQLGKTWRVPSFNPLWPRNPFEILQAKVEDTEPLTWNGETIDAWLVVYRDFPGHGAGGERPPRGRTWVRPDGTVLKQQIAVFNSLMTFERLPDDEAERLVERFRTWEEREQQRRRYDEAP